jgi:hypothetical protein
MSKELFNQMRELEAFELSATKKSCIEQAQLFVAKIEDSGEITNQEAISKALRYQAFINEVVDNLKAKFTEKDDFFGITITPTNGRKMMQYSDDPLWCEISNKLKKREELLKVALNSDDEIYDSEGVQVPKVLVNYAKDSLSVKF